MQSYAQEAPVLGLLIDPDSDAAVMVSVAASRTGEIARIVGGMIEAIELDGGSVMWLDADGKGRGLPTNFLATKVAHRLHAGVYPDDTINGRAPYSEKRSFRIAVRSLQTSLRLHAPTSEKSASTCVHRLRRRY